MKRSINQVMGSTSATSADANKPVFLSKAQREELALNRRHDQISDHRLLREQLDRSTHDSERSRGRDRDGDRDREPNRRIRDRKREEEEAKSREKARVDKLLDREKELDAIKEQYLGVKKPIYHSKYYIVKFSYTLW
ncbi:hypothetical protein F2Q68_00001362 [Brassica cretica]|uniref:Uncharacterized protein n=1 Tax=Brassica cretica TaxID=69181 RepID=A0A8S9JN18_BRACR|nr:hypothetical protein F2Q68_00001362 [Brassica cretica]